MKQFEGRVAVVTGAASGIGFSLASQFAAAGCGLVIADLESGPLDAAAVSLRREGAAVVAVPTDVSDSESVAALAEATESAFGRANILCNNAGVEGGEQFDRIPMATWEWVMAVDFWGVLHGCRSFLPLLRREEEAHIVNTGSLASFATGTPTMTPYVCAKFAVLALSESLEIELRAEDSPVRVSLLAPGPVRTRMTEAERNRPAHVPPTDASPARRQVLETLREATDASGHDPDEVAAMVLEAIREERFFVLPHPNEALAGLERRRLWMSENQPPPVRRPAAT